MRLEIAVRLRRHAAFRYGVAVACVALAWAARGALRGLWGQAALPFITFFPSVAFAAWLGAPWFRSLGLEPIYAMAVGVMAGGLLQLGVQVPALARLAQDRAERGGAVRQAKRLGAVSGSRFQKSKREANRELERLKDQENVSTVDREKLEAIADTLGIDYSNKNDEELRNAINKEVQSERK